MIKSKFIVEGLAGKKVLAGSIRVGGAKNAVLKALAATILFEDTVVLDNVPAIEDVERIGELLAFAGAQVEHGQGTMSVVPPQNWKPELERTIASRLRASIVLTGPMLARVGEVHFPFPGGCVLGERPIDLFLDGFTALGATVEEVDDMFVLRAPGGLVGARFFMPFVSVTATETLMMAAVLARGTTVLGNAAVEPEIVALAEFLVACGANITGVGTSTITIVGTGPLRAQGTHFATPPDRIEAGSFILFGALLGSRVEVTHCNPHHVDALLVLLRKAGVRISTTDSTVLIEGTPSDAYTSVSVRTHEYPGFPTDLQAPMAVFLSQCAGECTILETIFDGRFRYADDLVRMGADITVMNPHKILLRGPRALSSKELEGPDLRAGLAYLLAAAVAEGTSVVTNAYLIDRGYEKIEERLRALGLNITRVESE
jgi:UDP-N-acetylglucosamine 1-carboxyvinyltransferase